MLCDLIKKISTSLQVSLNSLESNEDKNKITEEVMEDAHEKLLDKYTQLSNLRDKNIEQGKTEIDTDTLHGLQEAFLISNHMIWLRTLSENLQKATKKYRSSMINT